jgi:hypothetical protein
VAFVVISPHTEVRAEALGKQPWIYMRKQAGALFFGNFFSNPAGLWEKRKVFFWIRKARR